jgi:hypothetical protein
LSVVAVSATTRHTEVIDRARMSPFINVVDEDLIIRDAGSIEANPLAELGLVVFALPDYTSTLSNTGAVQV